MSGVTNFVSKYDCAKTGRQLQPAVIVCARLAFVLWAHYFIDARGEIRYHHFGEGKYDDPLIMGETHLSSEPPANYCKFESSRGKLNAFLAR